MKKSILRMRISFFEIENRKQDFFIDKKKQLG